jgi:hypothetical protein
MNEHYLHNINDHLHYLNSIFRFIFKISRKKKKILPDDDPSCGKWILGDGVILAVSENVSIHERTALTVVDEIDLIFVLFGRVVEAVRAGERRRKLTRFKND